MAKYERSEGAVLLARVGSTQEEIAAATGIHRVRIAQYKSGQRMPGPVNRKKFKKHYGIPEASWDKSPKGEPATPSLHTSTNGGSVLARAERLQNMVDELLDKLNNDAKTTPLEKAKVMASTAGTITLLGKLTGESREISEARIIRLPAFRRVVDRMKEALRPWPEAARAVGEALKELDG